MAKMQYADGEIRCVMQAVKFLLYTEITHTIVATYLW